MLRFTGEHRRRREKDGNVGTHLTSEEGEGLLAEEKETTAAESDRMVAVRQTGTAMIRRIPETKAAATGRTADARKIPAKKMAARAAAAEAMAEIPKTIHIPATGTGPVRESKAFPARSRACTGRS